MATCNGQDLLDAGRCFSCLTSEQLDLVRLVLLFQIATDLGLSDATPESLLEDGRCFECYSIPQMDVLKSQLLCEILTAAAE